MELKLPLIIDVSPSAALLIVPYGIETTLAGNCGAAK